MVNKTQYDWFPGKSQNSKKFHTKTRHSMIGSPERVKNQEVKKDEISATTFER